MSIKLRRPRLLNEGIEFDPITKLVSYLPHKEDYVDTSLENNPTVDDTLFPDVKVWSIFKRKKGEKREDGNPLVYALKGEKGWKFKSEQDRKDIETQFDKIASKFAKAHKTGTTILMPSGSDLNEHIAEVIASKSPKAEIIKGVICKITTETVADIVLDFDSKFRKVYKDDLKSKYSELCGYLDVMDKERDGYFTRHLINNPKMRDVLDTTLKVSDDSLAKYANKINGQDILIIDDTISRGQTIREACKIMKECYAPKSITVLTLLSKLYEE